MKKVLSAALVSLALIGTAATAFAVEVPGTDAPLKETLNFWQEFADRNSGN